MKSFARVCGFMIATLVPCLAQAQQVPAAAAAPAPAPAESEDTPGALRVLAEFGVAAAAGALSTVPLFIADHALTNGCDGGDTLGEDIGCALGITALGFVGYGLIAGAGTTYGTYLTGNALGGHGSIWYTLIGSEIGLGVSVGAAALVFSLGDTNGKSFYTTPVILTLAIGPVLGAVLGYELSNDDDLAPGHAARTPSWLPHVAMTPDMHGGEVGVAGRF